jgi:hypothetical protein
VRSVLLLLLLAACAAPQGGERVPGEAREAGTVRVVGSLPLGTSVHLSRAGRADLVLRGDLVEELAALAGAEVEVTGRHHEGALHAHRYRLLSVGGAEAFLGVVEVGPGGEPGLRLEDGSLLLLAHPPAGLRPGDKVWVQGPAARALHVQSYGRVRAASAPDRSDP